MDSTYISLSLLVVLGTLMSPVITQDAAPESTYQSEVWRICQGDEYEIGCGEGNGDKVLNITRVTATFVNLHDAIQCQDSFLCSVKLGTEDGTNVPNAALNGILTQAKTECNGRPFCKVRLPSYNQVKWNPDHEDADQGCGLLGEDEYLSQVSVKASCVDAGTVTPITTSAADTTTEEISTKPSPDTTTIKTTTTTTTEAPTSKATQPTKPQTDATKPPVPPAPTTARRLQQLPDRTLAIIIVCSIVGVALFVAVVVGFYIMFRRATSKELHLAESGPTEHAVLEKQSPVSQVAQTTAPTAPEEIMIEKH